MSFSMSVTSPQDSAKQSASPAHSHSEFPQLNTLTEPPPFDCGNETPEGYTLSRSVTPTPFVDVQPNEPTPSIPSECPICGRKFSRAQERDRHLESYLPHSIHCPFQGCPWTGRRRWDLKTHWEKKHPKTNQILEGRKIKYTTRRSL
ncbi:hypothetical protein BJV77DRAFT_486002 [Russula vinacea]|nr:hypothetical protein BJV77DRAFT_486002 [Russula vinacea]